MKVQGMRPRPQRVEQDIESVIYRRRIYAGGRSKHIFFGKHDDKNLRLDASHFFNCDSIDSDRKAAGPIREESSRRTEIPYRYVLGPLPHVRAVNLHTVYDWEKE